MRIDVVRGDNTGAAFSFNDEHELIIGREISCEVCVNDELASERHARVFMEQGSLRLEDLDSDRGTSINGRMLAKTILTEGDEVAIGDCILRFTKMPVKEEDRVPSVFLAEDRRSVLGTLSQGHANGQHAVPTCGVIPQLRVPRRNIAALQVVPGEDTRVEAYEAVLGKMKEGYFARDGELRQAATHPVRQIPLERENLLLHRICALGQAVADATAPGVTLGGTLDEILDALECDTASVLLREAPGGEWKIRACAGALREPDRITVSHAVIGQAIDEGLAVLSVHPPAEDDWELGDHVTPEGITTSICSPFPIEGQLAGMLIIERRNRRDPLRATDLRVATAAGNVLGLFLNAEKSEERARTSERLAVIGEVVCGLGHHTKNLVNALNFGVLNLQRAVEKGQHDGLDHYIDTISAVQRSLQDAVLDMLSYSKPRIPCKNCVDLQTSLDRVLSPYREGLADKGIEVDIDVDPAAKTVWADQHAVERVFSNLLGNSLDALDRKEDGVKLVRVTAASGPEGHDVAITFHDTGCGIPKEKLASIFEAFYSTKGSCGTGLGLAVSKKIAEEHGGQLLVDSVENEWTEFVLTLETSPATHTMPERLA